MFWRDKWLRDQLLAYKYPRVFLNSNHKDDIIANVGT